MRSRHPSKQLLFAGILGIAIGGCGNSGSGSTGSGGGTAKAGAGGAAAGGRGGSAGGGQTGIAVGGSSGSGGHTDQPSTGGTTSPGAGGSSGSAGQNGGSSGGGGQGGGGQTGGQAGRAAGGSGQTGGGTGAAGRTGAGGQAGQGGSGQTGGATGAAGQSGGGGVAGRGAGGAGATGGKTGAGGQGGRSIFFGTLLDAQAVVSAAQELAKSLANPSSSQWQAKGDQHRTYRFAEANTNEPYRIYVPTNWDGKSSLPLAMFLHGSGSDENSYLDQNSKQMVTLAQEHGYLLVSPLGDKGAYGNFLRLTAPFGDQAGAAELMAQVTTDSERTNELSEKDVINVLELVLAEYPVDRTSMFLFGHSMGSGGTWYIGGKYADYWKGIAPMSGPFVEETGYPWDAVRRLSIFVTEGTQAPSVDASHLLRDWLKKNSFKSEYEEVNADHGGMIKPVLPDIFDFFDRSRTS